jgi:hypothetical protein
LDKIPKSGGRPKTAKLCLVRDLGEVYKEATGKDPTRRFPTDAEVGHRKPYGPFFDFVAAVLAPFEERPCRGLDDIIKKYLEENP